MRRINILISIVLLGSAFAWAIATYRTFWFAGDYMFSPFLMFLAPATIILALIGGLISRARRSSIIAASTAVSFALMVSPLFCYEWLLENSWRMSIQRYSEVNKTAIKNADFSNANLSDGDFPYEGKTVVVPGFQWYCEQHLAAPDGKFRGFVFRALPHVSINKRRGSIRGIAWIENPANIPDDSPYRYKRVTDDGWYVWTYGD